MPNVPVFINKSDIAEVDKICKTKGCNRYQFCKGAVRNEIERFKEIDGRKEVKRVPEGDVQPAGNEADKPDRNKNPEFTFDFKPE